MAVPAPRIASDSGGKAEPELFLLGLDAKRSADVFGGEHPGGGFYQPIEFGLGHLQPFMPDGPDAQSALQQLLNKLLACDGIVGGIMACRRVPAEGCGVFDMIFGQHNGPFSWVIFYL